MGSFDSLMKGLYASSPEMSASASKRGGEDGQHEESETRQGQKTRTSLSNHADRNTASTFPYRPQAQATKGVHLHKYLGTGIGNVEKAARNWPG